jgi:hypothetical protein
VWTVTSRMTVLKSVWSALIIVKLVRVWRAVSHALKEEYQRRIYANVIKATLMMDLTHSVANVVKIVTNALEESPINAFHVLMIRPLMAICVYAKVDSITTITLNVKCVAVLA